jgi:hypothetical protein
MFKVGDRVKMARGAERHFALSMNSEIIGVVCASSHEQVWAYFVDICGNRIRQVGPHDWFRLARNGLEVAALRMKE